MENIEIKWDDDDPIFNNINLEKSKQVFYWYEQQYDAVTAIFRNIFEVSAELDLRDYFAKSYYNYSKNSDDNSFTLEWILCEDNGIYLSFDIEYGKFVGFWTLSTSSKYGNYSLGDSFLYYTYAKIDDVIHKALGYVKEAIEYGNNK